jgi:hypothetical protein
MINLKLVHSPRGLHSVGKMFTMTPIRPVTVGPPDSQGGRLVHIHNDAVGRAYGLWDMTVFLHRAGLDMGAG